MKGSTISSMKNIKINISWNVKMFTDATINEKGIEKLKNKLNSKIIIKQIVAKF